MKIHACRVGPIPKVAVEDEEEPGDLKAFLGPGDRLFAAVCSAPEATISATSNMATELAEKALRSTPVKKADLIVRATLMMKPQLEISQKIRS